jgi:hypothetical protein
MPSAAAPLPTVHADATRRDEVSGSLPPQAGLAPVGAPAPLARPRVAFRRDLDQANLALLERSLAGRLLAYDYPLTPQGGPR